MRSEKRIMNKHERSANVAGGISRKFSSEEAHSTCKIMIGHFTSSFFFEELLLDFRLVERVSSATENAAWHLKSEEKKS